MMEGVRTFPSVLDLCFLSAANSTLVMGRHKDKAIPIAVFGVCVFVCVYIFIEQPVMGAQVQGRSYNIVAPVSRLSNNFETGSEKQAGVSSFLYFAFS